jgi:predicted lysophospholipase L1 biosynthesis ABC-type transport system permease subunit
MFQASLVSGRMFTEADLGHNVAIVDRSFVRLVFNGQNAVGRQVRDAGGDGREPGPWLEIVGVVTDLTDDMNKKTADTILVTPAAAEAVRPLYVAVHARTNAALIPSRVRIIAGDVDPALRVDEVQTLDKIGESERVTLDFFTRLLAGISIVAIVLATAGVYALMAFTVSRRTAEIGIRVALGANPRSIVMATFSRNFAKVLIGIVAGAIPAAFIVVALGPDVPPISDYQLSALMCAAATLIVTAMTALACVGPARRALHIQPTDALKSE